MIKLKKEPSFTG